MGGLSARGCGRAWLLALPLLLGAGCATPRGTVHEVRPGENLYRISLYYKVPVAKLARANDIRDVTDLPVGTRLIIPASQRPRPARALLPDAGWRPLPAPDDRDAQEVGLAFRWPVQGGVSSGFGRRWGRRHQGIDIPALRGTPIRAAESGLVIHSGRGLGDYGRTVILRHAGSFSTVYAHTHRNYVEVGDYVRKGQVIGEVGATGNARGSHLHFEIRRETRAMDPRSYLPGTTLASAPAS